MTYMKDLSNQYSALFVGTAQKIEGEMLPIIKAVVAETVAIRVHNFTNGSVIAQFNVITSMSVHTNATWRSLIAQAITTAANQSKFTFTVDPNYDPAVTRMYIFLYSILSPLVYNR